LKSLPVTVALASTYMTPVFGVMLAMLLLGERLTPVNLLGSGMVLAATVLVMRYDAGTDRQPAGGG
jgi:drug/metabolite transporter (DMT)-like permease